MASWHHVKQTPASPCSSCYFCSLFMCCCRWFSSGFPDVSVDTLGSFTWQGEESQFLIIRDWHIGHECWRLAGTFYTKAFIENAQNKKTGSWGMEHGEDKTLYLVSSLFILFAYKEISSHSSRKEHWQREMSVFRGKGKRGQAWYWKMMCMTMPELWGANTSPQFSFSYPSLKQMPRKDYESALWKQAPLQHYGAGINFKLQISVFSPLVNFWTYLWLILFLKAKPWKTVLSLFTALIVPQIEYDLYIG